jgi:hypothetical protein
MDELKSLFDNNSLLRGAIWENAIDNVDFWISEKLSNFGRKNDYCIGTYGTNYITVKDVSDFLEWVKNCNYMFEEFYGLESLIEKAFILNEKLLYWDLSDLNYDRVEKRLDEICDILADQFIENCTQEYDWYYKDENLFSFWLDEIGSQCGHWEECYTIGDGKVYRDYTKEIGA